MLRLVGITTTRIHTYLDREHLRSNTLDLGDTAPSTYYLMATPGGERRVARLMVQH